MCGEHGQVGDFCPDLDPVSVDIHLPNAIDHGPSAGTGRLEAREQDRISRITAECLDVVKHAAARRHSAR